MSNLVLDLVEQLNKSRLPCYDWFIHNIVFILEFNYNIDTGYSACDWSISLLGLWCPKLYSDTEDLIDQGLLYRTFTGELKILRRRQSIRYYRIPYQLIKKSPKAIIDLAFETYRKLLM